MLRWLIVMSEVNEKVIKASSLEVPKNSSPSFVGELISWLKIIIGAILLVAFIQRFIFMSAQVHGRSMYPTLEDGQRVILWSLLFEPRHEDIIIMEHTTGDNYVKRIIGMPGDHVASSSGTIYINDIPKVEPHILISLTGRDFTLEEICQFNGCEVIPQDYYLVLGDNRNNSEDSRNFGLIHRSQIKGRVIWRFWPLTAFGSLN